jgi:SAM-dependent methyltransferase
MSLSAKSSAAFFEAKYERDEDPWNFEGSSYEQSRYSATLDALEGRRWRSALEPGCSIGILTEGLASFCDRLLAIDFSVTAVRAAKRRCQHFTNVEVLCMELDGVPSFSDFDLIVLSEIGYYFTELKLLQLIRRIVTEMQPAATLLAVHWTGHSEDHEISGDAVHEILLAQPELRAIRSERHEGFRLDRFQVC